MLVVICYDISTEDPKGPTRLRKVAKTLKNYGQRVQFSVFECIVSPAEWTVLKHDICEIANPDSDSLRFYYLGKNWRRRVEDWGLIKTFDQEGTLLF